MASGIDSGTAAVIGAAVGAVVTLLITAIDRVVDVIHNRHERKRASRREIREALVELHRALAIAGHPEPPDRFAAEAANDLALTRLDLVLTTEDKPIARAASLASIAAMERNERTLQAIGIFRRVSGAWYRGELSAAQALAEYEDRVPESVETSAPARRRRSFADWFMTPLPRLGGRRGRAR